MGSATIIILLAFIALARANKVVANHIVEAQDSMNKLVNELFERTLQAWPLHHVVLDDTTLGKRGHLSDPSTRIPHFPGRGDMPDWENEKNVTSTIAHRNKTNHLIPYNRSQKAGQIEKAGDREDGGSWLQDWELGRHQEKELEQEQEREWDSRLQQIHKERQQEQERDTWLRESLQREHQVLLDQQRELQLEQGQERYSRFRDWERELARQWERLHERESWLQKWDKELEREKALEREWEQERDSRLWEWEQDRERAQGWEHDRELKKASRAARGAAAVAAAAKEKGLSEAGTIAMTLAHEHDAELGRPGRGWGQEDAAAAARVTAEQAARVKAALAASRAAREAAEEENAKEARSEAGTPKKGKG